MIKEQGKIYTKNTWENWSGSVKCQPESIEYPVDTQSIYDLIRYAYNNDKTIRVVGSGHSFTSIVATDSLLVSLDKYNQLENIDTDNKEITVYGGIKLRDLSPKLLNLNMAMENLGDYDGQSLAGAVSTGTHGSGISLGSISTQVKELTIVNAQGEEIKCSETKDNDLFKAGLLSLGTLGVISKIRLKLLDAYKLKCVKYEMSLDDCLNNLKQLNSDNRSFEFFWFPYAKNVCVKTLNMTEENISNNTISKYINDEIMENKVFKIVSELCRIYPKLSKTVCQLSAMSIPKGEEVNNSYKVLATTRDVKFQEMEYSFPVELMPKVIDEVRHCIESNNFPISFPLEVRFTKADDIWLSSSYKRDSGYIAIHIYKGMEYKEIFSKIEKIFDRYEGRPHWGKLHTKTAKDFKNMYPKFNDFNKIRKEIDPKGMFLTPYLKSLFEQ